MIFQFKVLFWGLLISLPIGKLCIEFCRKINLMDVPGTAQHKIHRRPVPIAGGLTLVLSASIMFFIFRRSIPSSFLSILIPAVIIFAFGLLDDIKGLSAPWKLLGQVLAAFVMIWMGVSIHIVEHLNLLNGNDLGLLLPKVMDYFLTIFWIIGIVNAFNLIDSMDGLVSGISAWACGFFIFAALGSKQTDLSNFLAIFLGIILILSFYNAFPAKLFLGDSGAQTLGFILAAGSIIYAPIYYVQASSWFVPILFFAIPIFDTCLVFVSRVRRHLPFYKGNLDHTYHRLLNSGIDSNRAVFSMQLVALIFDCLAMIAVSMVPIYSNLIFLACVLLGAAGILILDNPKFLVRKTSSQS